MPTIINSSIQAAGGDYATPDLWAAALPASCVAADEEHFGQMADEVFPTSDLQITSVCDATRKWTLQGQSGSGWDGHAGTGPTMDKSTGIALAYGILVDSLFATLEGFAFTNSQATVAATTWVAMHQTTSAADTLYKRVLVYDCLIYDRNNAWACADPAPVPSAFSMRLIRCGSYGMGSSAANTDSVSLNLFNNDDLVFQAYGCSILMHPTQGRDGFSLSFDNQSFADFDISNCVVVGAIGGSNNLDFNNQNTFTNGTRDFRFCVAGTAMSGNAAGASNLASQTIGDQFVSLTPGSEDLYAQPVNADGLQNGEDLITTPPGVEIDINLYDVNAGGDLWDRGWDQEGLTGIVPGIDLNPIGSSTVMLASEDPVFNIANIGDITVNPTGDPLTILASEDPVLSTGSNIIGTPIGTPLLLLASDVPVIDIVSDDSVSPTGNTLSALEENNTVTLIGDLRAILDTDGSPFQTLASGIPVISGQNTDNDVTISPVSPLTPGLGPLDSGTPVITSMGVGNVVLAALGSTLDGVETGDVAAIIDTGAFILPDSVTLQSVGSGAPLFNIVTNDRILNPPGSALGTLRSRATTLSISRPLILLPGTGIFDKPIRQVTRDILREVTRPVTFAA